MTTQQGSGYQGISNYLRDVLIPSITSVRITNIFDRELTDLDGFPAATITIQDLDGKFLDNMRNQRTYRFMVRIFIERGKNGFGTDKAEQVLRLVADECINKIDADISLGGNCIFVYPHKAKFGYIQRELNNVRLMEIQLDCVDAIQYK